VRGAGCGKTVPSTQEPGAGREKPYRGNHAFGVTSLVSEYRGKNWDVERETWNLSVASI
jgi:hypothetical protein